MWSTKWHQEKESGPTAQGVMTTSTLHVRMNGYNTKWSIKWTPCQLANLNNNNKVRPNLRSSQDCFTTASQFTNPNNIVRNTTINSYNTLFVLTSQMIGTSSFMSQNSSSLADNTWLILLNDTKATDNVEGLDDMVEEFVKSYDLEQHSGFHIDSQVYFLLKQRFHIYQQQFESQESSTYT